MKRYKPPKQSFSRRPNKADAAPTKAPAPRGPADEADDTLPSLLKQREAIAARIKRLRDEAARKACPFSEGDVIRQKGKRQRWLVLGVDAFPAREWRCTVTTVSKSGKMGKGDVPLYDDEGWTVVDKLTKPKP